MKASLTIALLTLTLLFAPTANAGTNTYPPENAAVLYYKAMLNYNPKDGIENIIPDIASGNAPVTPEAIKHIEAKGRIINDLITASQIEKCNWAIGPIEFRNGFERASLSSSKLRAVVWLVLTDARILASKGDYKTALERCITIEKIADHVSGPTFSHALVGFSFSVIGERCMTHILGEMPPDKKILPMLRTQLKTYEDRIQRMKKGFEVNKLGANSLLDDYYQITYTPEMIEQSKLESKEDGYPLSDEIIEKIAARDKDFYKSSQQYWVAMVDWQLAAFDLPYPQAYEKIMVQIPAKLEADVKTKPEAVFPSIMYAERNHIYFGTARSQNSLNALKTAVEIYLVKAKTGKLPDNVPAGSSKDLFSGKAFAYEKTDTGFILRCQAKDLNKDTIHEYEFKVAK